MAVFGLLFVNFLPKDFYMHGTLNEVYYKTFSQMSVNLRAEPNAIVAML